jgi:REP element-mobilizing transposase RayT
MNFVPDNLYHVYNQGNNKQPIFSVNEEYLIFLRLVRKLIYPHSEIIAYCLMPNHFHLLLYVDERVKTTIKQGNLSLDVLTNGFRKLLSGYTRIYNTRNAKSGSLFRQKTKYKCLSDINISHELSYHLQDYYFNCFQYIHQNPFSAGLISKLEDWEFSSFRDYAGLRNGTLCNKELAAKFCSYDAATFMNTAYSIIPDDVIKNIM